MGNCVVSADEESVFPDVWKLIVGFSSGDRRGLYAWLVSKNGGFHCWAHERRRGKQRRMLALSELYLSKIVGPKNTAKRYTVDKEK
jgi:hypothetical protein